MKVSKFAGQLEGAGKGKIPRYNEGQCKGEIIKTAHGTDLRGFMSRKSQKARMDREWSRQVVERDDSTCQKCGRFAENPHHVFYKTKFGSRWLLENGINLCAEDHHVPWAHAKPEEFMEWWRHAKGEEIYLQVLAASLILKVDLDEIESQLKKETICA